MTAPIDEARLRELAEAATPGLFEILSGIDADGNVLVCAGEGHGFGLIAAVTLPNDAAFIAAANPATILALLDALSAERERVADMQRRLDLWEPKPTSGSSIAVSSRIGGNNAPLATQKAEGATSKPATIDDSPPPQ